MDDDFKMGPVAQVINTIRQGQEIDQSKWDAVHEDVRDKLAVAKRRIIELEAIIRYLEEKHER